ncbi:DUF4158 domain-containing protein [Streptosporangium roseum]|uniref:DUF4158 domain-containing protein n=1 Tax=Streptosporangium roseum TaxID=2001 RepID=UPI003329DFB2
MPVEFLSDEQAVGFASFQGPPTRVQLEKYFFLDDADREVIDSKRRDHNRLGFAVQLGVVRFLRRFLPDPRQVPAEVVDYLAQQLGIANPSCIKLYGQRDGTARTHAGEIEQAGGWTDFAEVEPELARWIAARAFTTGEGPKALFDAAVAELRTRPVLMPGVHRLARLVAREREKATNRLWDTLHDLLNDEQRRVLAELVDVPAGARISTLERLRRPVVKASGPQMDKALERVGEIAALGGGAGGCVGDPAPADGRAVALRHGRQGHVDRSARCRAQARHVAGHRGTPDHPVGDALDLLDLLIATRLLARAEQESSKEKLRTLPRVERASATLAEAVRVLIEATDDQIDTATGEVLAPGLASVDEVWAAIEAVVPRQQLTAALEAITKLTPPADSDADEAWRAMLVGRFAMVRPFLPRLCEVIQFGATTEGRPRRWNAT